jgi:2-polyprenyl-6-methoxyphenol hydroxylase-like FAD-dependent oxidoreductase
MRILISGGGIAGLTLAFWLRQHGFSPTVVEQAPGVRGGGYMIDFWGLGFDVAEKMGIVEALEAEHCEIPVLEFVDERSRTKSRLQIRKMREMIGFRHFNLLRSGLERVLFEKVRDDVEIRFGASITALHEEDGAVAVELGGRTETFDVVVGADGLRSNTRRLVFGPDEKFERFLGYYTASYTVPNHLGRDDVFWTYTVPGRQVGIYPIGDGQLATFFIYSSREPHGRLSPEARKNELAERFADLAWETPRILEGMAAATDFYFDAVSQVHMDTWSARRVALVGDACQCVSLVAGQGSALAMAGAYVLAGELKRAGGDHAQAFSRYQAVMKPEIARKQKMALRFASSFVPASSFSLFVRDAFVKLMFLPGLSRYFIRLLLTEDMKLDDY